MIVEGGWLLRPKRLGCREPGRERFLLQLYMTSVDRALMDEVMAVHGSLDTKRSKD